MVTTAQDDRTWSIPRVVLYLLAFLAVVFSCPAWSAEPQALLKPDLAVTNGLIRWWPNLFDVRDEISGQEGAVMGLLPPVETGADDETEFLPTTGWVQLQPAITNEVFTFSLWLRLYPMQFNFRLLGQEGGEESWMLQSLGVTNHNFFIGPDHLSDPSWDSERFVPRPELWQHVAVCRRQDGTSVIWTNGVRAIDGRVSHPWPAQSRWLTVGNSLRGEEWYLAGAMRDLSVFDRVLSDAETRELYQAGVPRRPARNTAARLAATRREVPVTVSTNVTRTSSARTWVHRRYTTEDGLPGNAVKAVLQARNGYLWAGTEDGLARFDGRAFQQFTAENTPALAAIGQTVWSLSEEADGTIWAGIFGGLLRVRDGEFRAFTNGLRQRFVLQAEPAGDGSVWVAAFNHFVPRGPLWLRRYYPEDGRTTAEIVVPGHLRRMTTSAGGVWMAAEQPPRIYFWDGELPTLKVVGILDGDPQFMRLGGAGLPPQARARSWKHGAGRSDWWTAVSLGESGPEFCGLSDDRLTRVWAGRWNGPLNGGESWFGAAYDLARLGGDTLEKIELGDSLNGPQIVALCGNREGGIWFGSEEDGLHFLQEKLVRTFSTEDGLSGNDVRSVCAGPDGAIWVTTDRGLDRVQEGIVSHRGDAVGNMRSVGVDQSGGLWFSRGQFGTMALRRDWLEKLGHWVLLGLNWQDPNTIRFGRDGKVWVTCERGLTWVRPELLVQTNGNWVADPKHAGSVFGRYAVGKELPNIVPLGLVEDRDGSMWMGSLDKGGLFHLKEGRFERFDEKDGLPGQHWTPVLVDPAGALWVTAEGGLARRKEGRFQAVTPKEGLPKDWLLDMTEDDLGNFWISGKRGIHRVSKAELDEVLLGRTNSIRALSLGSREGMRTTECSSKHFPGIAKTPDGQIWVPTRDGLVRFDPRRVRLNTQPLEAFVDQLLAGKKREWNINTTGRAQTHELAPGAGERVEVHFTAISLAAADRIQFRYWLEGYDSDWSVPTDLRLAFYTNLRPGSYRFHVKAANSHGIWSDDEGILDFRILPYFWQTRSFYCGLASLALGLVAAFHLYRLNLQKRGQQMQMRQMLLDEKTRIAADMHDQLGATLTQIVILGEVAKSQAQRGVETYPLLDRISQAARDVTTGMSELVWATNPRNDTLENMAAYLREMAAGQLQDSGMTARLDFPASVPDAYVSATIRRNLVLILKEALHNAIKHSAASEVEVILALGGGELGLTVKDNGRGFSSDERTDRGNGLRNMQKRVADIGGVFRVESQAGHGTAIKVVVPLRSAGILPREEGNP